MAAKKSPSAKTAAKKGKSSSKPAVKSKKTNTASKRTSNKSNSGANDVRAQENRRFWSYILFFYGILEFFITFVKGDGLWTKLYEFNRGVFGISVFLFAPLIIYVAVLIATDRSHNTVVAKVVEGLILMFLISGAAQILFVGSVEGVGFISKLKNLYYDGTELNGGGIAGALLGWPLLSAFKRVGAAIVIILLAFTFIMLLTNITLPQLFRFLTKPFVGSYKAVSNERKERASRPPREHRTKEKKNDKDYRVDIAKYYQEDIDQPEGVDASVTEDELSPFKADNKSYTEKESEAKNKAAEKRELEKIAKKAVSNDSGDNEIKAENKPVYVEQNGQTTLFEKEESVSTYTYPPVDILKFSSNTTAPELAQKEIMEKSEKLVETLETFGVKTRIIGIHRGPSVTRYELQPAAGVKVKQITNLADDIALNLAANGVRIEAPIPGKAAIGIEIPNNHRDSVSMRELIDSEEYRNAKGKLTFAVGKDIEGKIVIGDIASMPHMLIAGTTGSGKTIFLYSIIVSLLHKYPMEDLEFLIIDPKQTDFVFFEDLPNLYGGHVVVDAEEALEMIQRINDVDKEGRMQQLRFCRSRDIGSYNEKNPDHRMKRLIIIIDEYADLIQTAEMQGKRKEFEKFLSMLAQKVRSLGIHLIIATQRPSANIVTGVLKANIPYRISFRLPSHTDSQTILDMPGAENLLGKGDMLMVTDSDTIRMQGLYISEDELDNFVKSRQ